MASETDSERKPLPTTIEGKLAEAETLKGIGNELFKAEDFKRARSRYRRAILFLKAIVDDGGVETAYAQQMGKTTETATPAQRTARDALTVTVQANIAACSLKLGDYDGALAAAQEALKLDPTHSKAKFRAAQAYLGRKNVERARTIVGELLRAEPDNKAVSALQKQIAAEEKRQDAAAKHVFGKMFA